MASNNDELYHYGVLGMKWGVRRSTKQLASARATNNSNKEEKATSSLNLHRVKSSRELTALKKHEPKLQAKADRAIEKSDVKAAKYEQQAAKYKRKAGGFFTSASKSSQYMAKAAKLEGTAASLRAKSAQRKAAVHRNKRLQETFNKGIEDIDNALLGKGEAYVKAYKKALEKANN